MLEKISFTSYVMSTGLREREAQKSYIRGEGVKNFEKKKSFHTKLSNYLIYLTLN